MAFRDRLRGVLQVRDTPGRIAMSFAIGVFWGMSPLLGIHTIGALFTAWLLGLNKLVAVAGVYITNPWTIVPIYSLSLWLGAKLIGFEQILPEIDWNNATSTYLINELKHLILPFFIGTFIFGTISAIASYFIIHKAVVKHKKNT